MASIDGSFGQNTGLFSNDGSTGLTGAGVVELPDRQYQRILDHEEERIRRRYGNGRELTADEADTALTEIDRLQQLKQARTVFLAHQLSEDEATAQTRASPAVENSGPGQAAIDAFRELQSKTPEERLFELLLKKRGLTPEELKALPPEEREKIVSEIKQEIREKVEKKAVNAGVADVTLARAGGAGTPGGIAPVSDPQMPGDGTSKVLTINMSEKLFPQDRAGLEDVLVRLFRAQDFLSQLKQDGGALPGDTEAKADKAGDGSNADKEFR